MDAPGRRRQEVGQQVEAGGLAGAIGPDKGMNGVAPDAQIDVLDCDEALELLGQTLRLQNDFVWPFIPLYRTIKRSRMPMSSLALAHVEAHG